MGIIFACLFFLSLVASTAAYHNHLSPKARQQKAVRSRETREIAVAKEIEDHKNKRAKAQGEALQELMLFDQQMYEADAPQRKRRAVEIQEEQKKRVRLLAKKQQEEIAARNIPTAADILDLNEAVASGGSGFEIQIALRVFLREEWPNKMLPVELKEELLIELTQAKIDRFLSRPDHFELMQEEAGKRYSEAVDKAALLRLWGVSSES